MFYLIKEKGVADAAQAGVTVSGLELGGLVGSLIAGRLSDMLINRSGGKEGAVGKRVQVRQRPPACAAGASLSLPPSHFSPLPLPLSLSLPPSLPSLPLLQAAVRCSPAGLPSLAAVHASAPRALSHTPLATPSLPLPLPAALPAAALPLLPHPPAARW